MVRSADHPPQAKQRAKGGQLLRPARRHSYYVGLSKKILWAIVIVLVGSLTYLGWGEANREGVRLVFSNAPKTADENPSMMNPRYQGLDEKKRPFTITANKATQIDASHVELEAINGDMTLEKDAWISIKANNGVLETQKKELDLSGDVHIYYEGGYEMQTEFSHVDINEGNASADVPIQGQGPLGTLRANAYEIQERGERLIFKGAVKVRLYPADKEGKKK